MTGVTLLIHKYAFENNINLRQKTFETIKVDIHIFMCRHKAHSCKHFFLRLTRSIVEIFSSNSQLVTKNVIAIQRVVWTFGSHSLTRLSMVDW